MERVDFIELISKGESHHLEFKLEEENNKDFAKTIVSFANTDGGKILIGVKDDGEIIGVFDVFEERSNLQAKRKVFIPDVCKYFNIHCIDTFQMLKELNFKL